MFPAMVLLIVMDSWLSGDVFGAEPSICLMFFVVVVVIALLRFIVVLDSLLLSLLLYTTMGLFHFLLITKWNGVPSLCIFCFAYVRQHSLILLI
jgi:hypothetical protein